jgi:hypothetical protein
MIDLTGKLFQDKAKEHTPTRGWFSKTKQKSSKRMEIQAQGCKNNHKDGGTLMPHDEQHHNKAVLEY